MSINTLPNKSEMGDSGDEWSILEQEPFTPQIGELKTKASARDLMEEYGDRVIYTDADGKETRMTLNPWAMMEDVLDNPDNMALVGATFGHMANRWRDGDKNPSRRAETNEDGQAEETGWENAIRVDDSKKIGKYISEKLKQMED